MCCKCVLGEVDVEVEVVEEAEVDGLPLVDPRGNKTRKIEILTDVN